MQDEERLLNTLLDLVGDLEDWQLCFICPKCEIAVNYPTAKAGGLSLESKL